MLLSSGPSGSRNSIKCCHFFLLASFSRFSCSPRFLPFWYFLNFFAERAYDAKFLFCLFSPHLGRKMKFIACSNGARLWPPFRLFCFYSSPIIRTGVRHPEVYLSFFAFYFYFLRMRNTFFFPLFFFLFAIFDCLALLTFLFSFLKFCPVHFLVPAFSLPRRSG